MNLLYENNKYICTDNCSGIYDNLIINTNKCIDKCENDKIYRYEYNKLCYNECQNTIINNGEEGICFDTSIFQFINTTNMEAIANNEDIYQGIINNILPKYKIYDEEEIIIKGKDNFYFQITNLKSDLELLKEKYNRTNNFSILDLGKCEDLLKESYNISKNNSLLL